MTRNNTKHPVLTVSEAARALMLPRHKVYGLIEGGTLDAFRVGANWRIKRSSINRLIPSEELIPGWKPPAKSRWEP